MVRFIVSGSIIEKSTNRARLPWSAPWDISRSQTGVTYRACILVYNQHETVKLANRIDARAAHERFTVLDIPDLQIAPRSLRSGCAKVDLCSPGPVLQRAVGPECSSLVARRGRGQDDFVGKDLGRVWIALDMIVLERVAIRRYSIDLSSVSCVYLAQALPLTVHYSQSSSHY